MLGRCHAYCILGGCYGDCIRGCYECDSKVLYLHGVTDLGSVTLIGQWQTLLWQWLHCSNAEAWQFHQQLNGSLNVVFVMLLHHEFKAKINFLLPFTISVVECILLLVLSATKVPIKRRSSYHADLFHRWLSKKFVCMLSMTNSQVIFGIIASDVTTCLPYESLIRDFDATILLVHA